MASSATAPTTNPDISLFNSDSKEIAIVPYSELWQPFDEDENEYGVPGCVRAVNGGLKFTDQTIIDRQKGVLTSLLKQIGNNIMENKKSIINISLPVRIFEPRSFLQRLAAVWGYAPLFLTKAAKEEDPLERFKLVITFIVAGLHRAGGQLKPFNPILGETYQAQYIDGSMIYCEQTSHHPPISAFQLFGPDNLWKLQGYHEYTAAFRPNGLACAEDGPNIIEFHDGAKIKYSMPKARVSGLLLGERTFSFYETMVFTDKKHHLRAELNFDPDALSGISSFIWNAKTPQDTVRGTITKHSKKVCDISGSWLDELKFDDSCFWTLGQFKPLIPIAVPDQNALPSDSRFRQDLLKLAANDLEAAQKAKEELEELQRHDRALRRQWQKAHPEYAHENHH